MPKVSLKSAHPAAKLALNYSANKFNDLNKTFFYNFIMLNTQFELAEQLKRAEEIKKVKEVKKEEPEDWQSVSFIFHFLYILLNGFLWENVKFLLQKKKWEVVVLVMNKISMTLRKKCIYDGFVRLWIKFRLIK